MCYNCLIQSGEYVSYFQCLGIVRDIAVSIFEHMLCAGHWCRGLSVAFGACSLQKGFSREAGCTTCPGQPAYRQDSDCSKKSGWKEGPGHMTQPLQTY